MEIFKKIKKISNFCIIPTSSFLNKGMENNEMQNKPMDDKAMENMSFIFRKEIDKLERNIHKIACSIINYGPTEEFKLGNLDVKSIYNYIELKCEIKRDIYPFKMF